MEGLPLEPFLAALNDDSARVRGQAVISFERLVDVSAAKHILPLTAREPGTTLSTHNPLRHQPDPGRVVPRLAVWALVVLRAVDACLEALDGPHADGVLWALRYTLDRKTVEGSIKRLGAARSQELQTGILTILIRLYYREADYDGSWWGIRPDNTGPCYDRVAWEMTPRIGVVLTMAILDCDPDTTAPLKRELTRHAVALAGVASEADLAVKEEEIKIVLPKADPANPRQIVNLGAAAAIARAISAEGDVQKGALLFKVQSCAACHTTADGQTPKGPHLSEIGKRSRSKQSGTEDAEPREELCVCQNTFFPF